MKIGIVPSGLIAKAGRMDADFYIGDAEERRVERAKAAIIAANNRLKNAEDALHKRDAKRAALGIKVGNKPSR